MDVLLVVAGVLVALVLFSALAWWKGVDSSNDIDPQEWQHRWI